MQATLEPLIYRKARPEIWDPDRGTEKIKVDYSLEGSFFQVLPGELMYRLLSILTFKELDNLLLVSKVFWKVIRDCPLPKRSDVSVVECIRCVSELKPIPAVARFWGNFQTDIAIDSETRSDVSIRYRIQDLHRFIFMEKKKGKRLLPNIHTLHMSFNPLGNLKTDLKELSLSLKAYDFSCISYLNLDYFLGDSTNYQKIFLAMNEVVNTLPNLKGIKLRPAIDLGWKISEAAHQLINYSRGLCDFKSKLSKRAIVCCVDYEASIEFLPTEEGEITLSKAVRYSLIQQCFIDSFLKEKEIKLKFFSNNIHLPKMHRISFDYHTIYDLSCYFRSLVELKLQNDFDGFIIPYRIDENSKLNEVTPSLIQDLAKFQNLKIIILKPFFAFYDDNLENTIFQLEHEKILHRFQVFAGSKIDFQIDFSQSEKPYDEDGILEEKDPIIREVKQKLVDANLGLFLNNIQKYFF